MEIHPYQKRTWAEVYLHNLRHNFEMVRKAAKSSKVCCVVKANAYGHGAVRLSKMYQEIGADFLAVSNVAEALQLRSEGISLPILILGYSDPECAETLAENNISQCVFSGEYATQLSKCAVERHVSVKIHIKIDTGMGRIGFSTRDLGEIEGVYGLKGLEPEGIFTHFSSADEGETGKEYTHSQFKAFCDVVKHLEDKGIDIGIRHCANSAAIFDYPETHLDMVRAGVVLYGVKPSSDMSSDFELEPALSLKTIVDFVKEVKAGDTISYGREFRADRPMKVATLPIGYADGLWRSNYKKRMVVDIDGHFAPIVGRICMDQCMVDVSGIPSVSVGSSVVVYGLCGDNSVDSIAKKNGTINYEILCAIGERVPRVYIDNDVIINIQDNIVRGKS